MPVQHSSPAKNTRSQRNPAVLTPTSRVPLDHTPSAHQLSSNLDRGPPMEGAAPSRRGGIKSRRKDLSLASWVVILACLKVQEQELENLKMKRGRGLWKRKILGKLKWKMSWQMLQRYPRLLI
ncbi:hypothetical protein O181_063246 [Austropuccinia psidii MF-1]|uniref:Uncharacterized protein n=1 Tax=Austropuccinia psidii MF-1 TaxID=1389203 RepID=A0A9Q3EJN0_9BASI|nr:hypothetical protein [Austropuccinia psidii MF-1]